MFCIQCGSQMNDGAKFCPKCGARVEQPTAPANANQTSANQNPAVNYGVGNQNPSTYQNPAVNYGVGNQNPYTHQNPATDRSGTEKQDSLAQYYTKGQENTGYVIYIVINILLGIVLVWFGLGNTVSGQNTFFGVVWLLCGVMCIANVIKAIAKRDSDEIISKSRNTIDNFKGVLVFLGILAVIVALCLLL